MADPGKVYIALNFLHNPQPLPRPSPSYSNQPLPQVESSRLHPNSRSGRASRVRRCCCSLLEALLLLPILLCTCGCVFLPSAVYFIPRDLLVNTSSEHADTIIEPPNTDINDPLDPAQNCSQGFFYTTGDSCVPSCEEFLLDGGVNSISIYRLVVMIVGALSCLTALGFVVVALTVSRKEV